MVANLSRSRGGAAGHHAQAGEIEFGVGFSSSKMSSGRITATGPGMPDTREVERSGDGFRGLLRLVHFDHAFR